MSRIGRAPIQVPAGVEVKINGNVIEVKGPKGQLTRELHPEMKVELSDGTIVVTRPSDEKAHRSLHGLTRTLIANMVTGVTEGFTRNLEIVGVGYRAAKQGSKLVLSVGYSQPVEIEPAPGIEIEVPTPTRISVKGIDKELVGQTAANIRDVRRPEPYLGKGIRYEGERVRRKAGKAGKA
ncbi:MAG: 50S ribosomal protein L6 [Limnochordia bacterium]|jgi:large subunit ribosomal protein L6|nr:50S ribosomal protein L6 [Limnochordia bacterium]MDI9465994.1 50S ribosomal protein L6 [Bacillota bacterium]NLO95594.1 50S ribosomal protein L6 [Bacillota bacterium]HAI52113.1 50S ribosomal protein L6 [Bacillota bacterium]HAN95875.1 50S ribosomal protein L6 [Bacillota bacterium]